MATVGHIAPHSPSRATQNLMRVSCCRKRASDAIIHSSAWHNGRALIGDSTLHLPFRPSAGFLLHLNVITSNLHTTCLATSRRTPTEEWFWIHAHYSLTRNCRKIPSILIFWRTTRMLTRIWIVIFRPRMASSCVRPSSSMRITLMIM